MSLFFFLSMDNSPWFSCIKIVVGRVISNWKINSTPLPGAQDQPLKNQLVVVFPSWPPSGPSPTPTQISSQSPFMKHPRRRLWKLHCVLCVPFRQREGQVAFTEYDSMAGDQFGYRISFSWEVKSPLPMELMASWRPRGCGHHPRSHS